MNHIGTGESQLLEHLKQGNSEVFFDLLHELFAWQIATWTNNYLLGSSTNFDDIIQGVFLKFISGKGLEYFENCNSVGEIRAIIHRTTHNYCKTQYQKAKRKRTENIDDLQINHTMNPQAERNLFGEDMQMLLNQISEKRKEVIVLKMNGFKFKEIAEELGIKESAAKNRYHHGIKDLRELHPKFF